MDAVVPWTRLVALIEPHDPKGDQGRPPLGLEKMLRIYFVQQWLINRARSRTRACGEHAFHVVKRLWGFTKVRYRGLAKNLARAWTIFALANLYLVRRQLLPTRARCAL